MNELKHITAIRNGDFTGLPIADKSTAINMTGSWKFFRPLLKPKKAPCLEACPLHIEIAEYIREFAAGNQLAALEILRRDNPLPAITGRVCPNFCQGACNRTEFDEALKLGSLERALGDFGLKHPPMLNAKDTGKTAAVIGSGPAGLGAAVFLARAGVKVTIFEKDSAPGGLLRFGIPAYRLPRPILDREIDNLIESYNIEIKCNHRIESGELTKLTAAYDTVIGAPGLSRSRIPADWADIPKIKGALDLLKAISCNETIPGQNFVIIGGGNAALDAARSLKRLGKTVKIIYRRSRAEMPAYPDEIMESLAEGLLIQEEVVVEKAAVTDDGLSLNLHRSRKNNGQISAGDFLETITCDFLIAATGQESTGDFQGCGPKLLKAGDFAHGAASVAEALASGRQAAESALEKLGLSDDNPAAKPTENPETRDQAPITHTALHLNYYEKKPAATAPRLDPKTRIKDFAEVNLNLTPEQLADEARRCLHCGSCTACGICWFFCPDLAIAVNRDLEHGPAATPILFDYDHCKGCGQCAEVCPRGVIEMEEDL